MAQETTTTTTTHEYDERNRIIKTTVVVVRELPNSRKDAFWEHPDTRPRSNYDPLR